MPAIVIGQSTIKYTVRFSSKAKYKRLVVTPGCVEVVAPLGTQDQGDGGIVDFVYERRKWLYNAVKDLKEKQSRLLPQYYKGGAKLQYRGRWLMLVVKEGPVSEVQIRCRSKFHIEVPVHLKGLQRELALKDSFERWLKIRAQRDLKVMVKAFAPRLDEMPKAAKLFDGLYDWGTCTKAGIIRVHWQLIQAPKHAMAYVVAHELAHLSHRNHGPEFWRTLSNIMPQWQLAKKALESWEVERRRV